MELTLQNLKDIAQRLSYKHHHNLSIERLREQLILHCEELNTTLEEVWESVKRNTNNDQETKEPTKENNKTMDNIANIPISTTSDNSGKFSKKYLDKLSKLSFSKVSTEHLKKESSSRTKEAMKLVRVLVTCHNKNKMNYLGEILTVRNAVLPEIKKFVPFNTPVHIPKILYNMLKEKEMLVFQTTRDRYNNEKTIAVKRPEFSIQILDPLTKEELKVIANRQLLERSGGVQ